MGISPFKVSKSIFDDRHRPTAVGSAALEDMGYGKDVERSLPNPDPNNYIIIKHIHIGNYMVVMVNYPDCKNYEGNKILVFENANLNDLDRQGVIDPHFSENKNYFSPIARFEPTDRGWDMARNFARFYKKE